jgi:hypothetical protein
MQEWVRAMWAEKDARIEEIVLSLQRRAEA